MNAAVIDKIDKSTESFRDKILRKCGESVEMKEKFFEKYADEIEELSRDMAKRFVDGKKLLTMGNGGSLATRCISRLNSLIRSLRNAPRFR